VQWSLVIHLDGTSEESRAASLAGFSFWRALLNRCAARARYPAKWVARYDHGRDNKSLDRSGVRLFSIR
jgi:hypothetical protein